MNALLAAGPRSERWPELSRVLDTAQVGEAARPLIAAIAEREDLPERLALMADAFRARGQKAEARALAAAARALAPGDLRVRVLTEWLVRHQAPLWHFGIIADQARNEVYARALAHWVRPGMTVFEIGTGTGILAMLAVQAGASHVYTCERRADVAAAAREIVARNGMADRITVIGKDAHQLRLGEDLPERADLFVAEIVDNSLLGEQVLPLTELARHRFLKPDAILLPRQVSAMGWLVGGKDRASAYRMDSAMGFDLTPFNRFTPLEINAGKGGGDAGEPLSEAWELLGFDLRRDAPGEGKRMVTLTADRAGDADALMRWLRLDFGDGIVFENRPPMRSSWDPQLHILPTPIPVRPGDSLAFEVSHRRDRLFVVPPLGLAG